KYLLAFFSIKILKPLPSKMEAHYLKMQRDVYEMFTVKHGIRITPAALNYISAHVSTIDDLKKLLRLFISIFNTSEITEDQAKKILTKSQEPEEPVFVIHSTTYKAKHLSSKYDKFKSRISTNITSISLLEEDEESAIFGIFYKNGCGVPVLEDDHRLIALSFETCESDSFLYENMFVALRGKKINDTFLVKYVILPTVSTNALFSPTSYRSLPSNSNTGSGMTSDSLGSTTLISPGKNQFLKSGPVKICVFGCYVDEKELLDEILSRQKPDIVIITLCIRSKLSYEHSESKVVICPCRCRNKLLPDRLDCKSTDASVASNPFILELHNKKIAVIDHNLFEYKKNGLFCNKLPLQSFLKGIHSQQSFNPFAPNDLSFPAVPDIFIIIQDFHPFVMDVENTRMVSLLPIKSGSYVVIETDSDSIEIMNIQQS
ncbi:DNA polymerase epsilon subunit 2, partial [Pancytospora epiphaga]